MSITGLLVNYDEQAQKLYIPLLAANGAPHIPRLRYA